MKQLSRIRSIIVFLCLFGASYTASATNYFSWDADSASTPKGTCNFVDSSIDATGGRTGGGALKYNMPDETEGTAGCKDLNVRNDIGETWLSGNSIYFRWWMKIDSDFNWGDRGIMKLARLTTNGGAAAQVDLLIYGGYIELETYSPDICSGGACLRVYYDFEGAAALNWQEYVLKVDLQSSSSGNGGLSLYVNGNLVDSDSGQTYDCSLGCGAVGVASWSHGIGQTFYHQLCSSGACGSGGIIWTDDISTDSTWNSITGTLPEDTLPEDTTPLTISSVQASSVTQTGVTITASTSEPADFQVEYGLTTDYGQSTNIDTSMVTDYAVTLGGLSANTTYHYRVRSTDSAGNLAMSNDETFTTLSNIISGGDSEECNNWNAVHPEWIWCDDFESANISVDQGGYLEYDNDSGDFITKNGIGRNDSYGMLARWQVGEVDAGSLKLAFGRNPIGNRGIRSTEDFRELYYRVYVRTQAGWTGDPEKLSRTTVFSKSDWSEAMIAHLWSPDSGGGKLAIDPVRCVSGSTVVCSGYNDFDNMIWLGLKSGVTQLFSTANANKWYCVEAHVKLNDPGQSNGIQEFWINDQPEAGSSNLNFVGSYADYGLNAVFLENYWNAGSPQVQERYLDNFVVSTQRIGCNPLSNLNPPMPPSNLQ